jgi:hypothetical protein
VLEIALGSVGNNRATRWFAVTVEVASSSLVVPASFTENKALTDVAVDIPSAAFAVVHFVGV